jgi:hypothetical protein
VHRDCRLPSKFAMNGLLMALLTIGLMMAWLPWAMSYSAQLQDVAWAPQNAKTFVTIGCRGLATVWTVDPQEVNACVHACMHGHE